MIQLYVPGDERDTGSRTVDFVVEHPSVESSTGRALGELPGADASTVTYVAGVL